MKAKLIFKWYDFWVGFFYDVDKKQLYFFPFPMFGLQISFRRLAEEDGAIQQIMDLCQKYWNDYNRNKAVVYAKNTETRQCFTFTRGEYSEELIEFIEGLK